MFGSVQFLCAVIRFLSNLEKPLGLVTNLSAPLKKSTMELKAPRKRAAKRLSDRKKKGKSTQEGYQLELKCMHISKQLSSNEA